MSGELKVKPVFGVILAVLVVAPNLVTSTGQDETTDELPATERVPEVNFEEDKLPNDDDSLTERAWAALRALAEGPWLALLLPLLLGLGLLQATLFHAAACYVIATLEAQSECRGGRWRRWRLTAAGALGAACGAQLVLVTGTVLVALRMRRAVHDGTFAAASDFGAFYPGHEVWYPLQPFLWATPVIIVCYWIMLTILCKVEEKKKKRKEKQKEKLVEGATDISLIKISKL